jgi:UDP-N-acetyl-2-amino-2-deoxyglucuronate dehydrogenase
MTGSPLRYGIVGCSGVGNTHAKSIAAADGVDLVAGIDLDESAAAEFAERHDTVAYTDLEAAIKEAGVEAVSICTPSGTHASLVVECAELGLDVLCEKPLDVTTARVNRMIAACKDADVTLAGIFQRRTHPGVRRAREAVVGDELGPLVLADVAVSWQRSQEYYDSAEWRGTREMDGGVMMNQAIHGIDMLQWLGGGVERVSADLDTLAHDIGVEDTAVVNLRFHSGARGQIRATTAAHEDHPVTLSLTGEHGSIRLEDESFKRFETRDGTVEFDTERAEYGVGHERQVQDFVNAIRESREPLVPAREARKAVDVILAAYASDERGEPVTVTEIREE